MKKGIKILVTAGCAMLLIVSSVAGTMAYLTSKTDTVENTFTVGKVEIKLDEGKADDDGKISDPDTRVGNNTYKLIPGKTYQKDPTVHIADGSEPCWVFAMVRNDIKDLVSGSGDCMTIEKKIEDNGWKPLNSATQPEDISDDWENYCVYYQKVLANTSGKDKDLILFSDFTIDKNTDAEALSAKEESQITVRGYAIQKSEDFDFTSQEAEKNDDTNALNAWEQVKNIK